MGYESRIYVVEKSNFIDPDDSRWAEIIASYNMCKYPPLDNHFRTCNDTDVYIFDNDGNTRIVTDKYDKPLKESAIEDVIEVLEKDVAEGEYYRRTLPLLNMLKAFAEHKSDWRNLTILHYGY